MNNESGTIELCLRDEIEDSIEPRSDGIEIETQSSLHELPPGRWRSLGRYLDYANWPERDRFVQLDRAIQLLPEWKSEKRRHEFRD